jgi:flagellin
LSISISTNTASMTMQRNLQTSSDTADSSLRKLASGKRINRAGDDAAGLSISSKMEAEARSVRQAGRNSNDGISVNSEVKQLVSEIERISHTTEFSGLKLGDVAAGIFQFQTGIRNNPETDRIYFDVLTANTTLSHLSLEGVDIGTKGAAQANLATLDNALDRVSRNRASLGAVGRVLESAIANGQIYNENLVGSKSRILDTEMAWETSELAKAEIVNKSSVALLAQANQAPMQALKLLG